MRQEARKINPELELWKKGRDQHTQRACQTPLKAISYSLTKILTHFDLNSVSPLCSINAMSITVPQKGCFFHNGNPT